MLSQIVKTYPVKLPKVSPPLVFTEQGFAMTFLKHFALALKLKNAIFAGNIKKYENLQSNYSFNHVVQNII